MRRSFCWHSVAGSQDNRGHKDSVAYPLISLNFFLSLALRHSKTRVERLLERRWQVERANLLVFWFRENDGLAASLQSEGTWRHIKPVLNSPCDRLQVSVLLPLFVLWDKDFKKKKKIHKDSQSDADATPQSHLPSQQLNSCYLLDTVTVTLALKNISHAQTKREWGVQSWCAGTNLECWR